MWICLLVSSNHVWNAGLVSDHPMTVYDRWKPVDWKSSRLMPRFKYTCKIPNPSNASLLVGQWALTELHTQLYIMLSWIYNPSHHPQIAWICARTLPLQKKTFPIDFPRNYMELVDFPFAKYQSIFRKSKILDHRNWKSTILFDDFPAKLNLHLVWRISSHVWFPEGNIQELNLHYPHCPFLMFWQSTVCSGNQLRT